MQEKGVQPNSVTFVGVLKARVSMLVLVMAGVFMSRSLKVDVTFVGNSLVDMSTKCGSMEDAWRVFNKMPSQNVVTWNAMVLMLGQCTLELFQQCNRRMLDQTLLLSWGC
jgi:pentatricopeptide repeat protein